MPMIDQYSYHLGVIDCFNEMVRAGVKKIALSHPFDSIEERENYITFSKEICLQYGTKFFLEDAPFLTDLFPLSMNKNRFNIIYYKEDHFFNQYLNLKKIKQELIDQNQYYAPNRLKIAFDYGELLSYSREGIQLLIDKNQEKE